MRKDGRGEEKGRGFDGDGEEKSGGGKEKNFYPKRMIGYFYIKG